MVDRAIAERNYPLLQSVGGPFSILTEFDVPDRDRFKRLIRSPTPPIVVISGTSPGIAFEG